MNEAVCLLRGKEWVFKSDFNKRDRQCLLRGTDWVFKSDFFINEAVYCAVRNGSSNNIFITGRECTAWYGLGL